MSLTYENRLLLTTAHCFCGPRTWKQLDRWSSGDLERTLQSPGAPWKIEQEMPPVIPLLVAVFTLAGPGPLVLALQPPPCKLLCSQQWHWVLSYGIVFEWLPHVLPRLGWADFTENFRDQTRPENEARRKDWPRFRSPRGLPLGLGTCGFGCRSSLHLPPEISRLSLLLSQAGIFLLLLSFLFLKISWWQK